MQILTSIAGSDSADFAPVFVFELKKETTVYYQRRSGQAGLSGIFLSCPESTAFGCTHKSGGAKQILGDAGKRRRRHESGVASRADDV